MPILIATTQLTVMPMNTCTVTHLNCRHLRYPEILCHFNSNHSFCLEANPICFFLSLFSHRSTMQGGADLSVAVCRGTLAHQVCFSEWACDGHPTV